MRSPNTPTAGRWRAVAAVAALAGTTLLVAGAPRPAAADVDGFEIVLHPSTTSSNPSRVTTAECPGQKELIGVGASVVPSQTEVMLDSVIPDLGTESVEVTARESAAGTGNSWRIDARAVCADPGEVPGRYLATADEPIAAGASRTAGAFADCDAGDRALSGGFAFSGASGRIHLTTLLPTEDTVLAVGQEDQAGTAAASTVEAIALCADLDDSEVYLEQESSPSSVNDKSSSATCPGDMRATGGGGFAFDETGALGTQNIYSVRPTTWLDDDYTTVRSNAPLPGSANPSTLYSYAVCLDVS